MRNYIAILLIASLIASCRKKVTDVQSIYQWINAPENGLLKSRTVEGITLTVKYLPATYLAYKETKEANGNTVMYDSLCSYYNRSLTFLLTISSHVNSNENDPMYKDIKDYSEYKQRALTMNFDMASYISIKTPTAEYAPVLASMENTYSLRGQRNIYLVFTDQEVNNQLMKEQKLDFVFRDEIFNTGINHFVFEQADLRTVPAISFINNK